MKTTNFGTFDSHTTSTYIGLVLANNFWKTTFSFLRHWKDMMYGKLCEGHSIVLGFLWRN